MSLFQFRILVTAFLLAAPVVMPFAANSQTDSISDTIAKLLKPDSSTFAALHEKHYGYRAGSARSDFNILLSGGLGTGKLLYKELETDMQVCIFNPDFNWLGGIALEYAPAFFNNRVKLYNELAFKGFKAYLDTDYHRDDNRFVSLTRVHLMNQARYYLGSKKVVPFTGIGIQNSWIMNVHNDFLSPASVRKRTLNFNASVGLNYKNCGFEARYSHYDRFIWWNTTIMSHYELLLLMFLRL